MQFCHLLPPDNDADHPPPDYTSDDFRSHNADDLPPPLDADDLSSTCPVCREPCRKRIGHCNHCHCHCPSSTDGFTSLVKIINLFRSEKDIFNTRITRYFNALMTRSNVSCRSPEHFLRCRRPKQVLPGGGHLWAGRSRRGEDRSMRQK